MAPLRLLLPSAALFLGALCPMPVFALPAPLLPELLNGFLNPLPRDFFAAKCYPNPCKGVTKTDSVSVCGDPRLGPIKLPNVFPVNVEMELYARYGDLCPAEFLEKWTNDQGQYIYPSENGFALDRDGKPIMASATLPVGRKLDRFGSEYGSFLAPLGAPYIERSLPPSNLNHPADKNFPYNYHVYEVLKPLDVQMGPIASWFEQPGLGTQFMTTSRVMDLVSSGHLKRLTERDYDEKVEYSDDTAAPL